MDRDGMGDNVDVIGMVALLSQRILGRSYANIWCTRAHVLPASSTHHLTVVQPYQWHMSTAWHGVCHGP